MDHSLAKSDQLPKQVLVCKDLHKTYTQGPLNVEVLRGISFSVCEAETIAIVGASGSGKSTLLNLLGGLDVPSIGRVFLCDEDLFALSDNERGFLRNRAMGFVYQFHHLLAEFTAVENVAMPLLIGKVKKKEAQNRAAEILARVGLSGRQTHKPAELSGGERQRVAIARALVAKPACVLMDEPTGNLDKNTANSIHDLMKELNQQLSTSFIVVTHDEQLAKSMGRVLELSDGKLV